MIVISDIIGLAEGIVLGKAKERRQMNWMKSSDNTKQQLWKSKTVTKQKKIKTEQAQHGLVKTVKGTSVWLNACLKASHWIGMGANVGEAKTKSLFWLFIL